MGKKSHRYFIPERKKQRKGISTPKSRKIRRKQRKRVFWRDNHQCSLCYRKHQLTIHHYKDSPPFPALPREYWFPYWQETPLKDFQLIVLCKKCHGKIETCEKTSPLFMLLKSLVRANYIVETAVRTTRKIADLPKGEWYLVGSALWHPNPHDIDLFLVMKDEDFAEEFMPVEQWEKEARLQVVRWSSARETWAFLCFQIKDELEKAIQLNIPIDFKIVPESKFYKVRWRSWKMTNQNAYLLQSLYINHMSDNYVKRNGQGKERERYSEETKEEGRSNGNTGETQNA